MAWYAISAAEALAVFVVSSRWRILSFKHTHLPQRMGLLTIIILGEGVIGATKTVNLVVTGYGWTRDTIGQAIASVAVIVSLRV